MDHQLLREFLADAEDLIEALSDDIEALRARRGMGRERRTLTARIFRHVHTIKGVAASMELEAVSGIAHELESLLDSVRLGRVALDQNVLDAFRDAATALSETLLAATRGEARPAPQPLVEQLRQLAHAPDAGEASTAPAEPAPEALPDSIARSLTAYDAQRMREAAHDGASLYLVRIKFDLATFDQQFRALENALSAEGEVINTSPGQDVSGQDQLGFIILYASPESASELAARLLPFGHAAIEEIGAGRQDERKVRAPDQESADARDLEAATPGIEGVREPSVLKSGPRRATSPASIASLTTHLRIELEELDEAIYAAHELFRKTTATISLVGAQGGPTETGGPLDTLANDIRRRSVELEERLIALRMVPVSRMLKRAARAGLLAARAVGKEIDFELAGQDVRLDKSLVDSVSDPLLHLVRNAVDHGIETPGERLRAGKGERGRVRLEALAEGSRVRLRVRDDGRGMDPSRISEAARTQGIIAAHDSLDMKRALRLIFRPGFSTAASVTSVSGRGVGLDVVEHALEASGGELRVWSETGAGTTFEMLLPTTLALVHSFVVQSAGRPYCLDASHIADACLSDEAAMEMKGDAPVYLWRDARLPLVRLSSLLGERDEHGEQQEQRQEEQEQPASQPLRIVVARFAAGPSILEGDELRAERTVAIAVDGWEGYQKVLVRGLGRHAARWQGIGGATELNDGAVALLLDLPRLLDQP